jgi:hypothetical protein
MTLRTVLATLVLLVALPSVAQAAAPAGVTGMAGNGRVALAWQPVAGATGFKVYRGTSPTAVNTPLFTDPLAPTDPNAPVSFTDISPANGTTYYYAVRAITGGVESTNSQIIKATPRAPTCGGANVVAQENCMPGDSDWKASDFATTIDGYATASSINHGESVGLKVQAPGTTKVDLEIFRTGYYGGAQARLFSSMVDVPVSTQPGCTVDTSVGLYDCSAWNTTATLTTTTAWPSGVYLIRIVRRDSGDDSHILLVVRDDARRSDVLYGVPDTTYQAYNTFGGKSLYDDKASGANTVAGTPRAVKVSFDRPYSQPHETLQHDWYTRADIAAVSWLERSGYDVAYTADSTLERNPARVLDHRIFWTGSHDEYWSAGMRTALEQARDRGVDLFFAGANEIYWKIRFEPSPVTGAQDRVVVCYKSTQSGPADPSGIPTGTWRDPAGANKPENALLGQQYIGQKAFDWYPLKVSAAEGKDRIWRYTGLDTQPVGGSTSIGTSLVGWEWDARTSNGQEPPGVVTLASSPATGDILQDAGRVYSPGSAITNVTKRLDASGSLIFSTGTNHWMWGLAMTGAGKGEPNTKIQQATTNVLLDMGAAPETPASGMVLDDPTQPPAITQRVPASSATNVQPNAPIKVTFSRPMDGSTITGSTFTLKRADGTAIPATVSYDDITFTATLQPAFDLELETGYTARLEASIKAANGIALGAPSTWSFTTRPPDRIAPAVSISSPADGSTVVQTATITANASDDTAVASVQFKLDGNDLGSPDTSAPYSYAWDARGVSAGTHQLSAVAKDTSNNSTTSTVVSVTVDPNGLVAAYGFEESSSTTANDASGKSNPGTIREATHAAGKFGQALSFDGVNDWVAVPDSNSLDLTSAMTLEAWVNPNTITGWRTVMLKEQPTGLVYGIYANTDTNRPSAHAYTSSEFDTRGTAQVALNTWTHVAATYDGATLRFYVNGTQVSSKALTGSMITSTSPLHIGGNGVWGEWFKGLIDEVRIYRRALSASEIATDMTTPIVPPDSVAPSAPGTLTANGGVGQAQLSWGAATDNTGVARYNVHRSTTAGFTPSAANRVAQVTGTSYPDAGLAAGSWYYRVIAEDAAGNTGPASNEATATATADTVAPTVSVTQPAAGATVSGTVSLAANASDNVGVASVKFQVDGADVGSPDTSAPFTGAWTSTSLPNGTHSIRAIATDAAGNATTSAAVSVTLDNHPVDPTGLALALGFEEPSGTATTDASGSGNNGTLTGAARVANGKFGRAVSFSANGDWVTVPDAASLDITNAMTLEAWVNPTSVSGWQTALLKEGSNALAYGLYINNDTNRPSANVHAGSNEVDTRGTAQVATGTWTHLAGTYDGSTLRLYVNGSLASSLAVSGTLLNSTGALRIGGNGVWGEWFKGLIDEVRVYRRVLSASEIQTDMNTAVGAGSQDTTPPSAPGTLTATGSIGQAALSWGAATDDVGVARYDVHRSSTAGFTPSAANRVAQVSGTTYTDSGLAAGTWYYRVIAEDAAGNLGAASNQATATVTSDTTAPAVSLTAPAAGATLSGTATLTATASDNVGVAGVRFQLDGTTDIGSEITSSPYTRGWDTSAVANGSHTLRAIARDAAGNSTTSAPVSVTVSNTGPPPPTGLVAAYGFEETSATSATDSSTNGNTGTIREATRTAGKFGQALNFDGVNDWVSVNDAASLHLTSGMTLEAWVKPSALSQWRTVLMKERTGGLSYGLYANSDTNRPTVNVAMTAEQDIRGTAQLGLSTWTHLAATYDGTTLRLYVNGTQVATKALTGALASGTQPLRIGGNGIWGEWFAGLIDEVRVYDHALTATEITADMTRPVVPGTT